MGLNKIVMCYINNEYEKEYKDLPIIKVNIYNLKEKLLDFYKMNNNEKNILAKKSKEYVTKNHSIDIEGEKYYNMIKHLL
jgi:hypothetical protein